MGRLFGTDGVRGLANRELTPELALSLAAAAGAVLGTSRSSGRPQAVVGRDTRASGEFLEAAVVAGLAATGVDVIRVGVLPTPAVAFLVAELGAELGVMLSASHNPMPDNGIKFFGPGGSKLRDETEDRIAAAMHNPRSRPTGADVGRVIEDVGAHRRYVDHLVASAPGRLDGLSVVVDCAHGAASGVAPEVLTRLGARVTALAAAPNGLNINAGVGSTYLGGLREAVLELGADAGVAHDGDADRCLAVDHTGAIVDGDQIMAVLALSLLEQGSLAHDTLVATVMSNLGLRLALAARGVKLEETAVGDRYVLERMREGGFTLGGEQSGHLVMAAHATTGDGVLTAVHLLARMASTGKTLAELAAVMTPLPQVLINVSGVERARLAGDARVAAELDAVQTELGAGGRVLLRPSGTEPLVRVMVEASTHDLAESAAQRLALVVKEQLGV